MNDEEYVAYLKTAKISLRRARLLYQEANAEGDTKRARELADEGYQIVFSTYERICEAIQEFERRSDSPALGLLKDAQRFKTDLAGKLQEFQSKITKDFA